MMPFADIQLLFETLVQCTRELCKCEKRYFGSKKSKQTGRFFRELFATLRKSPGHSATALDRARCAP
jgi:hypothetical protein